MVINLIRPYLDTVSTNTKTRFYNIPCAFDIETSSFIVSQEKVAIMYEWTFSIFGAVIIGRSWNELLNVLDTITDELQTSERQRLIVYVHNLGYEFQYLRKWFKWKKVFAVANREPIYAITNNGIEFRCSYILSGYSLDTVGKNLRTFNIKKMVGGLDYTLLRNSKTELTERELQYCVNDVQIIIAYIAECIIKDGDISRIPLTKTGYVRNYCRNSCFYEPGENRKKSYKKYNYMKLMKRLTISPEEYKQLRLAFQGGFVHANPFYNRQTVNNVTSFDFTSSYPTVMIAEKFPMSSAERVTIKDETEFRKNLKLYCCLFDIEFEELEPRLWFEHYLSLSRCRIEGNRVIYNGRVVKADKLTTTITEQDFLIIEKFYKWKVKRVGNFRRYKKGYLPTDFIKSILKLYEAKTTLKGVSGKEDEYLNGKEKLNSAYGMIVTDIVRDDNIYDDDLAEWLEPQTPDLTSKLKQYNNSSSRFLFYPWGVWVTAYARRNLFSGILNAGNDYVYSDTDSIKILNAEKHLEYINKYNAVIREQLYHAMDFHGLPREAVEPLTVKGVKKCLGVWDFDGNYKQFKTLGAKRYLVEYSHDERNAPEVRGKYTLTVSGLNKEYCIPYLLEKHGKNGIFEAFDNNMHIPPNYTGKNIHTYIDDEKRGIITDYQGNTAEYYEKSSVHLSGADYSLKLSREYLEYLFKVQTIYY